jgi:hypothetical protein
MKKVVMLFAMVLCSNIFAAVGDDGPYVKDYQEISSHVMHLLTKQAHLVENSSGVSALSFANHYYVCRNHSQEPIFAKNMDNTRTYFTALYGSIGKKYATQMDVNHLRTFMDIDPEHGRFTSTHDAERALDFMRRSFAANHPVLLTIHSIKGREVVVAYATNEKTHTLMYMEMGTGKTVALPMNQLMSYVHGELLPFYHITSAVNLVHVK